MRSRLNSNFLDSLFKGKKIIISGSSAVDITIHAIKFLVGRIIILNFWPFDVKELKRVFPTFSDGEVYDYYSKFGGYPRVAISKTDEERKSLEANKYLLATIIRQRKTLDFLRSL